MSRADSFYRYAEQEENRLSDDYEAGLISREDYNEGLRELQREARDAYAADVDEAQEAVRDEWGR